MSEIATIDIKLIDDDIAEMQLKGPTSMLLSGLIAAIAQVMINSCIPSSKTYKLLDKLVLDICELRNSVENDK